MATTAAAVLELVRARPATLGDGRLVCIDGPAGSGKTTLSRALSMLEPPCAVVHLDDVLEGWGGLPCLAERLDPLLGPLAMGRAGAYHRYDWLAGELAEWVVVDPAPLLVLEGVGAGNRRHAAHCGVLVWVEVPDDAERLRRGITRDGEAMREHWVQFMRDEQDLFTDEQTRERADMIV